jgi:hypothetical protein
MRLPILAFSIASNRARSWPRLGNYGLAKCSLEAPHKKTERLLSISISTASLALGAAMLSAKSCLPSGGKRCADMRTSKYRCPKKCWKILDALRTRDLGSSAAQTLYLKNVGTGTTVAGLFAQNSQVGALASYQPTPQSGPDRHGFIRRRSVVDPGRNFNSSNSVGKYGRRHD